MTRKSALALSLVLAAAVPAALAVAPAVAQAQTANPHFPQPSGVLSLSAQASAEVPQDIIHITLFH